MSEVEGMSFILQVCGHKPEYWTHSNFLPDDGTRGKVSRNPPLDIATELNILDHSGRPTNQPTDRQPDTSVLEALLLTGPKNSFMLHSVMVTNVGKKKSLLTRKKFVF